MHNVFIYYIEIATTILGPLHLSHHKLHSGILYNRENPQEVEEVVTANIPSIDIVVSDLADEIEMFQAVPHTICPSNFDASEASLICSAATNVAYVTVVTSSTEYETLISEMSNNNMETTLAFRNALAVWVSAMDQSRVNYLLRFNVLIICWAGRSICHGSCCRFNISQLHGGNIKSTMYSI